MRIREIIFNTAHTGGCFFPVLFIVFFISLPLPCWGDIYRYYNREGELLATDRPLDAQRIEKEGWVLKGETHIMEGENGPSYSSNPEPRQIDVENVLQTTEGKPTFFSLDEALVYIESLLEKNDYKTLNDACFEPFPAIWVDIDKDTFRRLKEANEVQPLHMVFRDRAFPEDRPNYLIGRDTGYYEYIDGIYISFIQIQFSWYIRSIFRGRGLFSH